MEKRMLGALLNELFIKGKRELKIIFPIRGKGLKPLGLYTVKLGERPEIETSGIDEYADIHNGLRGRIDERIMTEIPDHNDYRLVFQVSGVLKPDNFDTLDKTLQKEAGRDLLKGAKPLYLGFDTNTLRHRLPSILSKVNCGYCLHSGILDELHPKWDRKMRQDKVNLMKRTLGKGFGEFFNQAPLNARKHRIGAVEYRKLMKRYHAEEIIGKRGDLDIIRGYSEFERERKVDLMLFSGDGNFVTAACDKRIKTVHIRQTYELPKKLEASWEEVTELLYFSALIYGTIKIGSITLYGIWCGKGPVDWDSESLKLTFEDRDLEEWLKKDERICKVCWTAGE